MSAMVRTCSLAVQLFKALGFALTRRKQLCRQKMVPFSSRRAQSFFYLLYSRF